jgi:hypothetical protein
MKHFDQINPQQILSNGITIHSSGTSGEPNAYFQSPNKIKIANELARDRQQIDKSSKVYTCCKITHAGGLLAQTLPALEIGAEVDIEDFNAYAFVRKIKITFIQITFIRIIQITFIRIKEHISPTVTHDDVSAD